MNDPKIAVVGAGNLSTRRIYPYLGSVGAQLVGVCDLDMDKARQNSRRFGGEPYQDMEIMLETENPDGVIICIGPEQHAELAPRVMRMGFPVYTEKPPAASASAALEVARVADETGVLCTTAFKKRYSNAYARARDWIEQFDPEQLYCISIDYASAQYANDSPRTLFLLDFAIHIIDLVGFLFGDVAKVFAYARGRDAYAVSLKFENGSVGSLNLNCGRSFSVPTEEVEITAEGGNFMTVHNSSTWRITEDGQPVEWREPPTFVSGGDSGNETGHRAELADFMDAIQEQRTTRSNIYESYKSMVLYEAIAASAINGEPFEVMYESP
ncbi:MAG: Gfo/Idh/MocA family oxidoreductase [Planctomycetes bacterium]|nr:Gfo/Idh/MocA family oxidoreductase [Planctomycetota bacterium]